MSWRCVKSRAWETRECHRKAPRKVGSASQNRFAPLSECHAHAQPLSEGTRKRRDRKKCGPSAAVQLARSKLARSHISLVSFNVGKGMSQKVAELEEHLLKCKADVVALQEVGVTKSIAVKEYRMFTHPKGDVAFLVSNRLVPYATVVKSEDAKAVARAGKKEDFDPAGQLWIKIAGEKNRRHMYFCSVHMPQEGDKAEIRDEAWSQLEYDAKRLRATGEVSILGDFNARPGTPQSGEEEARLGMHGQPGERTSNGKLLVGLLNTVNMVSLIGQKQPNVDTPGVPYWYTRRDVTSEAMNALDGILVSEAAARGAELWVDYKHLNSDHHMVFATVPCTRKLKKGKKKPKSKRVFRLEKLIQRSSKWEDVAKTDKARADYEEHLKKSFEGFNPEQRGAEGCGCADPCVCATVNDFITRTSEALEASVGSKVVKRGFSRKWYDSEVKAAVQKRRQAYEEYRGKSTTTVTTTTTATTTTATAKTTTTTTTTTKEEDWNRFVKLRKECNALIRRKKSAQWDQYLAEMDRAYRRDHKQLWRLVRRLVPSKGKAEVSPIQKQDGSLAESEEEIIDAWAAHQEKLGTPIVDPGWDADFTSRVEEEVERRSRATDQPEVEELRKDFDDDEVRRALESLSYHKASSSDGTKNPMFMCGGETMREQLVKLFNFLKEKEQTPEDWGRSIIVNLFKDGDCTDPGNYRGIALISCLGKIYLSMWARRITDFLETRLTDNQGGFRPHRSTIDQALLLHEALLRRQRAKETTYLYFVDFRKAFDTVWHAGLWKRLWDMGVTGKPWRVVRSLYSNIAARVRVGDQVSRSVRTLQGVRQGCPLSPVLFNCFVDELSKRLREAGYGVRIGEEDLHALLYADDVVILAKTPEELQELISIVNKFCSEWHMSLNTRKSEAMVVGEVSCRMENRAANEEQEGNGSDTDDDEGAEPPSDLSCPCRKHRRNMWICGDELVRVATKYKYLGIWFNEKLTWDDHIEYVRHKADSKSKSLRKLMVNNKIAPRAKLLVWLCSVRPLLEYGCEVWSANSKQADKLESIQTRAGVLIFKLNQNTHRRAVRALMGVSSLQSRWEGFRLRYYAKWFCKGKDLLIRKVLNTFKGKRRTKGPGSKHWHDRVKDIIEKASKSFADFKTAVEEFNAHRIQFEDTIPRGRAPLDPDAPRGEEEIVNPIGEFTRAIRNWTWHNEKKQLTVAANSRRSTVALMDKSLREVSWPHPIRLARSPLRGANQIRARLLCGMSALKGSVAKARGQDSQCPVCASNEEETVEHFMLECSHYDDLRTIFEEEIEKWCTCQVEDETRDNCKHRFDTMSAQEKVLFMLGMPVWLEFESWETEASVDAASKAYVTQAYKRRSAALEEMHHGGFTGGESETPLPEPLRDIRDHFIPLLPEGTQVSGTRTLASARPAQGSGSNGCTATERG